MRWRKGLSGTSTWERLELLRVEEIARERAFGEAYQERLDLHNSVLSDARDLRVRSVRVSWRRACNRIYICCSVSLGMSHPLRKYYYRTMTLK
jgi:hypothetical protein